MLMVIGTMERNNFWKFGAFLGIRVINCYLRTITTCNLKKEKRRKKEKKSWPLRADLISLFLRGHIILQNGPFINCLIWLHCSFYIFNWSSLFLFTFPIPISTVTGVQCGHSSSKILQTHLFFFRGYAEVSDDLKYKPGLPKVLTPFFDSYNFLRIQLVPK